MDGVTCCVYMGGNEMSVYLFIVSRLQRWRYVSADFWGLNNSANTLHTIKLCSQTQCHLPLPAAPTTSPVQAVQQQ